MVIPIDIRKTGGVIFYPDDTCKLSPLFDNGTSLGHERFIERIQNWSDDQLIKYVEKGHHHLRINQNDTKLRIPHFDLIAALVQIDDEVMDYVEKKLDNLDVEGMLAEMNNLTNIEISVPFDEQRFGWIKRNILIRLELIKEVLKNDSD